MLWKLRRVNVGLTHPAVSIEQTRNDGRVRLPLCTCLVSRADDDDMDRQGNQEGIDQPSAQVLQ